jgi:hypothetical protein
MIFGMRCKRKLKKYTKERELSGWNEVVVQIGFKPPYILEGVWAE